MAKFIVVSAVKKLVKEGGRRTSAEFITLLDNYVEDKLNEAIKLHNGNKKTLDATVAGLVGISPKLSRGEKQEDN